MELFPPHTSRYYSVVLCLTKFGLMLLFLISVHLLSDEISEKMLSVAEAVRNSKKKEEAAKKRKQKRRDEGFKLVTKENFTLER